MRLLQNKTGVPLRSFDAIVLGLFNRCGGDDNFSREMELLSHEIEGVDCLNIPPPTLTEWTQNYGGPIIFLPMMTAYPNLTEPILSEIEHLQKQGRDNLYYVDARHHIDAMGTECISADRLGVSDCLEVNHSFTHRCVGGAGGHPDLLAWDIVETLYEALT